MKSFLLAAIAALVAFVCARAEMFGIADKAFDASSHITCYGKPTKAEDKASIALSLDGLDIEPGASAALKLDLWAGVYVCWPVVAEALSAPKVSVSGLPSGLKYTAKAITKKVKEGKTTVTITNVPAYSIYGAPKTAKTYKTKITVKTAGKSSQIFYLKPTVSALPSWVKGKFVGEAFDGTKVKAVVAANGKITLKRVVNGKSVTFTASYFDEYDEVNDIFYATVSGKVNGSTVTEVVGVSCDESGTSTFYDDKFFDIEQYGN